MILKESISVDELIALGMNKNEAKVYLALIVLGKTTAREIIRQTKFHKNIVYDNLAKLADKGLVSQVINKGVTLFCLASANALRDFAQKQLSSAELLVNRAALIQKQINAVQQKIPERVNTELFVGVQAIRSFYEQTLFDGDYCVIGSPQASVDIMGATFWQNYNRKKIDKKNTARILFNESLRSFADSVRDKYTVVRFLPTIAEPLTEIHISSKYVAILVWTNEPSVTVIHDSSAAKGYKEYFELLWKISKK